MKVMMMDDRTALDLIIFYMSKIRIASDGKKATPMCNTTVDDCFEVLWKIKSVLENNSNYNFKNRLDAYVKINRLFKGEKIGEEDAEIQHVGYDEAQCGREK